MESQLAEDLQIDGRADLPEDIAPREPLIELPTGDWDAVHALERDLGIGTVAAQTLATRGYGDSAAAREWIGQAQIHPARELPGVEAAAAVIAAHLRLGSRIAVHGDYDVDGVSSTAILVRSLAALGADVTWHVPSRFEDGYGLTETSVDRVASAGAELIVTVDCGVGSIAEVAHAKSLGIDVVICDHHVIGPELPDAPVVHPGLGGYPDPWLCAAATTYKLAEVVAEEMDADPATLRADLALVGLATVCDVVPLRGENRALVRAGIDAMRATDSPGLRELIRVAGVDQLKIGSEAFGFALGPRINAAGRMHSAEPAVELLLTRSQTRAEELAALLAAANRQRREVEQGVLASAEAQARAQRDRHAIVVSGEGWHPGVLGIVAGRLAERYHRPAIVLTLEGDSASGSARSGGSYDLHAGLGRCARLLNRFGGHKAAAGLELDQAKLSEFAELLAADAAAHLTRDDLRPRMTIDAVADASAITLETIAELEALGPFGAANPTPKVLLAASRLVAVATMGKSGGHYKLTIDNDSARANVVAFRQEQAIDRSALPRAVDLVVEVQRNEFNGREEAQAVLRALAERGDYRPANWREEFDAALVDPPFAAGGGLDESQTVDRQGRALPEVLLEFGRPGGSICVVVNDPLALRQSLGGVLESGVGEITVKSFDDPGTADAKFDAIVMADPPPAPSFIAWQSTLTVAAWGPPALRRALEQEQDLLLNRDHVVAVFRATKAAGRDLDALLLSLEQQLPSARIAARALQVLSELDIVTIERNGESVDAVTVRDSPKTGLDRSITFRSYSGYREESTEWLRRLSTEIN